MMKCRVDGEAAKKIISYGKMPIANGFLEKTSFPSEYFFELSVAFCSGCKMLQLINQPSSEKMFHENYAFFSSTSKKMEAHFKKMANEYLQAFITNVNTAFVVELGSNDGIMLKNFAELGIQHLGIEPSLNVAKIARQRGVNTISEFFNAETAKKVAKNYGKADIISAANVMCHIPDLSTVGRGIEALLKENGVFVFEDPYLADVVQKTAYDQLYDEHVYIFSVQSVMQAFSRYGLELFHVAPQPTHGGSMRYYMCHKGKHPICPSVEKQLAFEQEIGLDQLKTYERFAKNCEKNKHDLLLLLKQLKAEGKRVVGYAATSKSTTVLNYCDIGPDLIEYICDTTPIKQGKYTPGTHIPIKSHEYFKNDKPDYTILFAWNHAEEIFEKENHYMSQGGKWVLFVPEVKVL